MEIDIVISRARREKLPDISLKEGWLQEEPFTGPLGITCNLYFVGMGKRFDWVRGVLNLDFRKLSCAQVLRDRFTKFLFAHCGSLFIGVFLHFDGKMTCVFD